MRLHHVVADVRQAVDDCHLVGLQTSLDRLGPALAARPAPRDWDTFAATRRHYAGLGLAAPVDGDDDGDER